MYTKQEASKQRQAFWTTFGQYMQPILSADGEKTNWINYKTGISGIHFKMDVDDELATIAIILSHPDAHIQHAHYTQLLALKTVLEETLGEPWEWLPQITDEYGKTISKISTQLHNVNIYRTTDWPQLISFFKPRIISLDTFWSMAKYSF